MSQKQDKKTRQYYRRDMKAEMKKRVDELIPQLKKTVKKPPRFFPKALWYKLATYFINLE